MSGRRVYTHPSDRTDELQTDVGSDCNANKSDGKDARLREGGVARWCQPAAMNSWDKSVRDET